MNKTIEIANYELIDSDTNESCSPDDLAISVEEYEALIVDSLTSAQAEGHVRTSQGRKVYAA